VLEHRPITARRASAMLRTRRWVQRHPALAVGIVLGAALVVGGPSVYAWQQHEANVAIAAKNTEIETQSLALSKSLDTERELRTESDAQRARAERNFSRAFEAVSTMLRQVGAKDLVNTPEMDDTRRQLLERALDFFHRFVRDEGSNRALRVEVARTQRSIADVCFDLGRIEESELAFKAALEGMRALRAEQPGQLAHVAALSNTLIGYGRFLTDEGRLAEAIDAQDEAIELARLVLASDPANSDKRVDLAYALSWRGLTQTNAGRRDDGERDLDESLSLTRNPDGTTHENADLRQIEGRALITLGLSHYYDKQLEEADTSVRRALAIREEAWKAAPTDRTSRMELSEALADLALVHWGDSDPAEAENAMRRAIELQEALIRDYPRVTLYRQQVSTLYGNLGALVEQRHHDAVEGERLLARAVDVLQPLLDERPNAPEYQFEMGAALSSLAAVQRNQGRLEEACATIERGLACERIAHSISEAKADYVAHLRTDSVIAADSYIARGMHAKAAEHARNAREYGAGDWTTLALAATRLAKCVELVDGDTALGDDERAGLIESYTNESLDTLRTALDAPGFDWSQLSGTHYLDSVRANPRFDEIDELAKSRDP
jgi:tetratricopeptide (TPR) repeat protein